MPILLFPLLHFCQCDRSEEHTSELQSRSDLVCRLLLEKKKKDKEINAGQHRRQLEHEPPCGTRLLVVARTEPGLHYTIWCDAVYAPEHAAVHSRACPVQ